MSYPNSLPIGMLYPSKYYGKIVPSQFVSLLTCRWGPEKPRQYYVVPILSGLVCEWVPAEDMVLGYANDYIPRNTQYLLMSEEELAARPTFKDITRCRYCINGMINAGIPCNACKGTGKEPSATLSSELETATDFATK